MDIPPNQTLYVKNVTDKVKKEPLKKQLYMAFSAYGRVIDVVVMKGEHLRSVRKDRVSTGVDRPTDRLHSSPTHPARTQGSGLDRL